MRFLPLIALWAALPLAASEVMIGIQGGIRFVDKDAWDPVGNQIGGGLCGLTTFGEHPIGIYGSVSYSTDKETSDELSPGVDLEFTGRTLEVLVGPCYAVRKGGLMGYFGGGLAIVDASFTARGPGGTVDDSGTGIGPWAGGGVQRVFNNNLGVGVQLTWSHAKAEVFEAKDNAGGVQLSAVAAYHF